MEQTHVADVGSVARVGPQDAVEEVVVGTALQVGRVSGLTADDDGDEGTERSSMISYLLEDEERGEGSGDVQLDEVQTGLPVRQRCTL